MNPKIKPLADELLQATGIDSYSNLLAILITKYGGHLRQTWQLLPTTAMMTNKIREETVLALEENHTYDTNHSTDVADPVISRIAELIETF